MREIKFRAWDKERKEMFSVGYIDFNKVGNNTRTGREMYHLVGKFYTDDPKRYTDTVELMQFTGLTDKNGKDCYDGDFFANSDRSVIWQIFWDTENARWWGKLVQVSGEKPATTSGIPIHEQLMKGYEVIGNIHENPELLK